MRRPRDYDAELKALDDKVKQLRERKLVQLGKLLLATSADRLPVETLAGVLLAAVETNDATITEAWRMRGAAFFPETAGRRGRVTRTITTLRQTMAVRCRLQLSIARSDRRAWVVRRRERTRQLIELGGLVAKTGLVELTDDHRAVLFGLLSEAAATLRSEQREQALTI